MADDFLHRWSRLKKAARANPDAAAPSTPAPEAPKAAQASQDAMTPPSPPPLPPVQSLTPESDFAPFMGREVDPAVRRQALRTLFSDERFNVMDGLDVYIDDYSKPDPIPEEWMGKLEQLARLGHPTDPPAQEAENGVPPQPLQGDDAGGEPAETSPALAQAQPGPPAKPLDSEGEFAPPPDTPS